MAFRVLSNTLLAVALVLLSLMGSSGDACLHAAVGVPRAWNAEPLREAPLVQVGAEVIRCSGSVVGSTEELRQGAPGARAELEACLNGTRQTCQSLYGECPGIVALEVDRRVASGVVKSVLASAVRAGYPHHDFVIERWVAMGTPTEP